MDSVRIEALKTLASDVRKDIVRMVGVARSGSIETPLSMTDVFVYLYCEAMTIEPENHLGKDRDRFLLGMSAAVPALYAVLARSGYFDREELWHYKRLGAMLLPLPDFGRIPGIDAPCLLSACEISLVFGLAESLRMDGFDRRIFCLIGKDECLDRDFWPLVKIIAEEGLYTVVLLLAVPSAGQKAEADCAEAYARRFTENGWEVSFANGHDFADMERAFGGFDPNALKPKAVFVSTLIGKGLSFSQKQRAQYTKLMSLQEMDRALEELENGC